MVLLPTIMADCLSIEKKRPFDKELAVYGDGSAQSPIRFPHLIEAP